MKRILSITCLVVFLVSCVTQTIAAPSPLPAVAGVLVEFFNNTLADGIPAAVRIDPTVDFSTDGAPAEGVAFDFSARWSGFIVPPQTDKYIFVVSGHDSVRFTFNGEVLVDDWDSPTLQNTYTKPISLEAGKAYPFSFQVFDRGGTAAASLGWYTETGIITQQIVPTAAFQLPYGPLPMAAPIGTKLDHEVCVPDLSDPSVQISAGTEIPSTLVYQGSDLEEISVYINEVIGWKSELSYRAVIIPIGYSTDEIAAAFSTRVATLQTIVNQLDLNVEYGYLNKALPIMVEIDGGGVYDIKRETIEIIKAKFYSSDIKADLYIFDVNADARGYAWSLDDGTPFIVLDPTPTYLKTNIHELGHALGLNDGYENSIFYNWGDYPSSEFFLADNDGNPIVINPDWKEWLEEHPTKFIQTEMLCLEVPLMKMEGAYESIMDSYYEDEKIYIDGRVNPIIFTDFQLWWMRKNISDKINQ